MKKPLLFLLSLPFAALVFSSYHDGAAFRLQGNRTGSAGGPANCSGSGCHAANTATTRPSLALIAAFGSGGPYTQYTPGTTYRLVIGGTSTAAAPPSGFGFQLSAVKATGGTQAGSFQNGSGTRIVASGALSLVEHNSVFMAASSFGTQEVLWTAPAAGTGQVKFYLTINAVNTDNTAGGDAPNNVVVTINEDVSNAVAEIPEITGLSLSPNPASGQLHLHVEHPKSAAYELCIFDLNGKMQLCQKLSGSALQNTADIDISALPTGFYAAKISGGNSQKTLSFIKK